MVWIITGAVIGFIVLFWNSDYQRASEGAFGALIGAVLGFLVAMVIGAMFLSSVETVKYDPVPLENLADGSSELHGSFFLGSGVVDETSVFTWYEQSGDNSFRQKRADADESVVHYVQASTRPYYVKTVKRNEDGPALPPWGFRLDPGLELEAKYDFYVPRGTIKNNFELDAK